MKFFDEIVILGLERCQNRIDMVTAQLQKFGLSYKVFPSFDGKDIINPTMKSLTRLPNKAFANFNPGRPKYLPGMLGCALSHISAIKYAQMNNLNGILILEDDVIFSNDFLQRLELLKEVPSDAQIIYLGGITTNDRLSKKYNVSEHVWDVQKMGLYGMHSYIVTRHGYAPIIKKLMEFEDSCDALVLDGIEKQEIKGYTLIPWCTYQSEGTSEIESKAKTSNHTKTLFSPDHKIENICGYNKETKGNNKPITSEYSYEKAIKPKSLF